MKSALRLVLVAVAFAATGAGAAERYPTKPVRLIVPYAPGGGSDTIARVVGLKLGEALGESFVIDNRHGAASMVAAASSRVRRMLSSMVIQLRRAS